MRTLIRGGLLLAGAAGFCVVLAAASSADVVEPASAYQPTSVKFVDEKAAAEAMPEPADAEAKEKTKQKAAGDESKPASDAVATPAPEQVVRQAPAHLTRPTQGSTHRSVAERVTAPLRAGLQHVGASLGRVVSACEVGLGNGAGGPVLTLAVLAMAVPFIRRRVVGTRWTAEEDMPEFLYARELTPPG